MPDGWVEISPDDLKRLLAESKDDKDFRKKLKALDKPETSKSRPQGQP